MTLDTMRHSARTAARQMLLQGIARLTGRPAALLPPEAAAVLLDARAPYRLNGRDLEYTVFAPHAGRLQVQLFGHVQMGRAPLLWSFPPTPVERESRLVLDLEQGSLVCEGAVIGTWPPAPRPRRFTAELNWRDESGRARARRLGHYLVRAAGDEAYFAGDHYHDYERQAEGDVVRTMARLREWGAAAPLLEIGCATGLLLEACGRAGLDAVGLDVSEWALARARTRVAASSVMQADVNRDTWPAAVSACRFATVVMNAVLEHVDAPEALLQRVAQIAAPGALLFLTTANANSLTRWLFGDDWEGLADPTHRSAHRITPDRLRDWLAAAGWEVQSLTTHSIWDDNPDPIHATLRDVAAADARFRYLLLQYERGDFLDCVARRRAA